MPSPESVNSHESARNFPTIWELVHEPSPATLLELAYKYKAPHGKFVRIGRLILIAPFAKLAPDGKKYPNHIGIIEVGLNHSGNDLATKVKAAVTSATVASGADERLLGGGMHDAGWYQLTIVDNQIQKVGLERDSFDFGRADAVGRQHSVEAFQTYMGTDIRVSADD